jgi:AraC family transcriptional regulator, regulatory protein of adaptative response / DNA-3-methyladenine glycosylase II
VCHGVSVHFDSDRVWQAIEACDPRFDGWVFCGVKTTGIYCRPSCPARTPKRENVRFFASAAAAQSAGFRACKRCRPDATPGSPEWDLRADLVGRAMRLIADGVVDREGVGGLARRLGYTERHVHRQLVAMVGASPLALARAQRAQTARILLETTALSITDVTFASGFQSVRQFNATVQEVFAMTPSALRARARKYGRPEDSGALSLRLPYRAPLDAEGLIAFLGLRAVRGIEEVLDGAYRRSLRLPHGTGVVELRPADGHVHARYWLADLRDLGAALQRSRGLLDLDSDPQSVADVLGSEQLLGPLAREAPGRRVPGAVDGHELAVRSVLGQQVSLRGASTLAGRLVARYGEQLERPLGAVTHVFPSAEALAGADPEELATPHTRRRGLLALVTALARGELVVDAGADRTDARRRLLALPGIGPWTAEYIAMRALRDPDAFLPSDLGVRHALERLGRDGQPASAMTLAERWRPYRAYAVQHLWASLDPSVRAKRTTRVPSGRDRLAA